MVERNHSGLIIEVKGNIDTSLEIRLELLSLAGQGKNEERGKPVRGLRRKFLIKRLTEIVHFEKVFETSLNMKPRERKPDLKKKKVKRFTHWEKSNR